MYGPGPRIVSFILNASINSLPTPDFLKIMNYRPDSACNLCQAPQCTMMHILSCCPTALQTKRYTWRHDSVLAVLEKEIRAFMDKRNKQGVLVPSAPQLYSSFVRAMEGKPRSRIERKTNSERGTLTEAIDWEMMVDTPSNPIVFPPHICPSNLRPDIVIWSNVKRIVVLIELTCPSEENVTTAAVRKESKYLELKALTEEHRWSCKLYTVEVGVRGFVARSATRCL